MHSPAGQGSHVIPTPLIDGGLKSRLKVTDAVLFVRICVRVHATVQGVCLPIGFEESHGTLAEEMPETRRSSEAYTG